jgi:Tfp pilus assembly protein PilV
MGRTVEQGSESGISLIEVMISALVVTVALGGIAMTMVSGIAAIYYTQEQLIAKQKAREAMESVFTARSTQNLTFVAIQNVTEDDGIFLTGYQPIRGFGTDGIANTADDAAASIETITFPGPDNLLGTADDEVRTLTGFEREIIITNILDDEGNADPDVRQITVNVRFRMRNVWQTVSVSSYISRFA